MSLVSIIIPVIRPSSGAKAMELARKNAGVDNFEIVAGFDFKRIGAPKMVQRLAAQANGDLICFIGDDTRPRKNWLKFALADMAKLPDGWGLVGLNDRSGRDLAAHWLGDKRLLPLIGGEWFHTGYKHSYCDCELQGRCIALGRYRYSHKALVDHIHPILRKAKIRGEYARIYSREWRRHDHQLYKQRAPRWEYAS